MAMRLMEAVFTFPMVHIKIMCRLENMSACCEIGNVLSAKGGARVEVLKQVIRLMKRIEGAFCRGVIWIRLDYFQQGGCNEEEAYAYANSNMGRSARYYPHYQMWVSHLVNG